MTVGISAWNQGESKQMKKLFSVMIGLSMLVGAASLTFGQEKKDEQKTEKKESKKKKKEGEGEKKH
jgi:Tfp pilus assembly protein PilN